ncbi:unnamed protein product [Schistocephalus solidus]|uniref:Endonuclease n=1 Tax=Schistocephalus solidus TaxID=70667 RepID=A0A183SJP1_SCHSO|nr:unnamed protein product [Schistocephalus solidus]
MTEQPNLWNGAGKDVLKILGLKTTAAARGLQKANYAVEKLKKTLLAPLPNRALRGIPRATWASPLTLAAWNVRFILENLRIGRPERRASLVARAQARYKVDIAVLNET